MGDDAFGERIQINFDWVLEKLTGYVAKLALPDFFDYIVSFVQLYHGSFTESNLNCLLQAIVARVISEHQQLLETKYSPQRKTLDLRQGKIKKTKKKSSKNIEFRIAKCWSVIRYVAEH